MKIGFTRAHAISILESMDDDCDIDPADREDYTVMDNEQLEGELCMSGAIHDTHMAGVFDVLPSDVLDAEKQGLITGWPVTP